MRASSEAQAIGNSGRSTAELSAVPAPPQPGLDCHVKYENTDYVIGVAADNQEP